jgi:hypothetical protein
MLVLAAFLRAFWQGRQREGAFAIVAGWIAYQVTLQLSFSAQLSSLLFWIFAAAVKARNFPSYGRGTKLAQ